MKRARLLRVSAALLSQRPPPGAGGGECAAAGAAAGEEAAGAAAEGGRGRGTGARLLHASPRGLWPRVPALFSAFVRRPPRLCGRERRAARAVRDRARGVRRRSAASAVAEGGKKKGGRKRGEPTVINEDPQGDGVSAWSAVAAGAARSGRRRAHLCLSPLCWAKDRARRSGSACEAVRRKGKPRSSLSK